MSYIVKALSPELADTYVSFFENVDFGHAPHWATCFCRYYQNNCSTDEWYKRTGSDNKKEAYEQIKLGKMKGFLAFDGDKCIGWCNANDADNYIRLDKTFKAYKDKGKVGCVICFVINPKYRNQGVARLLLKEAVNSFKAQGFNGVFAMPEDNIDNPELLYRGTFNMYKELGFEILEKHNNTNIMFKKFEV